MTTRLAAAKKAMATGITPAAVAIIAKLRMMRGNHPRRDTPRRIDRSASGRVPSCCSRSGSRLIGPCSTSTSPARRTIWPGLSIRRSPARETAIRFTPKRSRMSSRPAVRPIRAELTVTTASMTPISSPSVFSAASSPMSASWSRAMARSSASGDPPKIRTSPSCKWSAGNTSPRMEPRSSPVTVTSCSFRSSNSSTVLPTNGEPSATVAWVT